LTVLAIEALDGLSDLEREALLRISRDHVEWYASKPVALRVRMPEDGRSAQFVALADAISVGDRVVPETQWEELIQSTVGFQRRSELHVVDRLVLATK
jgi:hypothetical protein